MPKPFIVWKILKEMGIPEHLTWLLRNLYAGQEAPIRTGHGTEPSCQFRRHEIQVRSLAWEDPLEEGTATHSSILAWRAPVRGVPKSRTELK